MSLSRLIHLLLILLFFEACHAQDDLTGRVDRVFEELVEAGGPGYAAAILKNGEVLYAKGHGLANLDYRVPISKRTAFSIASVSKQFTAACIALMILDGTLDLETPASSFIPELRKYRDTIRIKHLVYNTSGIRDYRFFPRPGNKSWITFNFFSVEECIATSLAPDSLMFKPGARWDYCNVNFMLLTRVVEVISGQSFAAFAKERLFEPLGMENTLVHDDITLVIPNRAMPYARRDPETVAYYREQGIRVREGEGYIQHHRNAPHYGGSGIVTTLEDLCKWTANFHTRDFGGDAFYELMHRKGVFPHGRNNQAFGLYFGDFNGRVKVAWDGGDWGISTELARFPDQGVAIICLSNLGSGEAFRRVTAMAEILQEAGLL